MILETNTGMDQKINTVLGKHVSIEIKMKVELPTGTFLAKIAILVGKGKTKLNNLEEINIDLERSVVIVRGKGFGNGFGHHSREFGIHGHVGVLFNDLSDASHFIFDIFGPNISDFQCFPRRWILKGILGSCIGIGMIIGGWIRTR
mmetsp:Transcript_21379/g.60986  ORF Transcript_21379/g.60986 Transcript_21379/m.60986 type:complete len:146 (+) Transcript_21379:594-1031(+)